MHAVAVALPYMSKPTQPVTEQVVRDVLASTKSVAKAQSPSAVRPMFLTPATSAVIEAALQGANAVGAVGLAGVGEAVGDGETLGGEAFAGEGLGGEPAAVWLAVVAAVGGGAPCWVVAAGPASTTVGNATEAEPIDVRPVAALATAEVGAAPTLSPSSGVAHAASDPIAISVTTQYRARMARDRTEAAARLNSMASQWPFRASRQGYRSRDRRSCRRDPQPLESVRHVNRRHRRP